MAESEARRLTKVINETALTRITEAAEHVAGSQLEDKTWIEKYGGSIISLYRRDNCVCI